MADTQDMLCRLVCGVRWMCLLIYGCVRMPGTACVCNVVRGVVCVCGAWCVVCGKTREKTYIPKALREQVWLKAYDETFSNKCYIDWCTKKITPSTYHLGHNIPESQGGETTITNLFPSSKFKLSMSNKYTIEEWVEKFK